MTHTNTTIINTTAKNTAEMQLLAGDQRALRGILLVTAISKLAIDSQKTTVLPMLAQTCRPVTTQADVTNAEHGYMTSQRDTRTVDSSLPGRKHKVYGILHEK